MCMILKKFILYNIDKFNQKTFTHTFTPENVLEGLDSIKKIDIKWVFGKYKINMIKYDIIKYLFDKM